VVVRASAPTTLAGARVTIRPTWNEREIVETVPIDPDLAVVGTITLSVDDLQLLPYTELAVKWDFLDVDGAEYSSVEELFLYSDTSPAWGWSVFEQDGVSAYVSSNSTTLGPLVLDETLHARERARSVLGVSPEPDISIFVYPTVSALAGVLALHNVQVQDWIVGYTLAEQGVILLALSDDPNNQNRLKTDINHEVVHLVIYADLSGNRIPGWFGEGTALWMAGEHDPTLTKTLYQAIQAEETLPLSALCATSFSGLPARDAALSYAQSLSLVEFIVTRYGSSSLTRLMDAYRLGNECQESLTTVLETSADSLQFEWKTYVRDKEVVNSVRTVRIVPWVVAWGMTLIISLLLLFPRQGRFDIDTPSQVAASNFRHSPGQGDIE
jgi:hypothetical protein